MTVRRIAQCPTLAATFTPTRPSRLPRNSPNEPPAQSTARLQRVRAHPLDAAEHQHEPRDVVRFGGAQGEPAVAGEDRGHAVPRSGRRGRVPVQLRVVVGVDVDEARRDGQTVGVDDLARLDLVAERADLGDAAVVHCDIRGACRPARPVHDGAAPDEEIDRHQRVMPYRSRALVPKSPARASWSIPSVHSRNSSTTPGYLASLCGKSLAHTAFGAVERPQHRRRRLARIEADPALTLEVLLRRQRQRRRGPAVALEELAEPVHPMRDPAAAALEDRDLQPGVPLEHPAVHEVRQRHLLVEQQDERVVRSRRHHVSQRARCTGHVGQAGGMERDREAGLTQRFPHGRYAR